MGSGRAYTRCGVSKQLSEFFKDSKSKQGLRSSCKDCDKARGRAHDEANRENRLALGCLTRLPAGGLPPWQRL